MTLKKNDIVSALVILRPASGKPIHGRAIITAENVAEFSPEQAAADAAAETFRARGFEVGPVVGVSFSITAPVRVFEDFFGFPLLSAKHTAIDFLVEEKVLAKEISGQKLPRGVRDWVQAVAFSPPPDFGPTEFRA